MRILLLNDNPVVRKLVALSAQKTKDDLDVIWSLDEIEYPHYDLLIIDDALYSDEAMAQLKAKISFRSSLLMATRGAATPAGFDKVINKPFLPTDLVELFVGIANTLPSVSVEDVLDNLVDDEPQESDLEEYNLDDLLDEDAPLKTNVLDSQEVQELQGLLDETDDEDENIEFDSAHFETPDVAIIEDLEDELEEVSMPSTQIEDLDELDDFEEPKESLEDELSDEELEAMLSAGTVQSQSPKEEEIDLEALLADMSAEELLDEPLSDDDFEDLEQQIQDAMGSLEPEDLEQSLDEIGLDDLALDSLDDDLNGDVNNEPDTSVLDDEEELAAIEDDELDELVDEDTALETLNDDMSAFDEEEMAGLEDLTALESMLGLDDLDEREIRLAIGEELDDEELDIRAGNSEHAALDVEALSEAMGKLPALALDELDLMEDEEPIESSPAAGMEALQSLLKALSNDEVAKSLKGLNISININFGNDK
jgi:uncharacterized membrane protein